MNVIFFHALIYIVGEFFPLDGEAHLRLLAYYLKQPVLNDEMRIVLYSAVLVGIMLFFIKDIIQMFSETIRGSWRVITGRRSFKMVSSDFKWFNIFISMCVSSTVSFLIFFPLEGIVQSVMQENLYIIGLLLVVTAVILRLTKMFTLVKIDGKLISIRDMFIFGILQGLSWFPGLSRTGLIVSIGNFLGLERMYITKFAFISIIPVLIFKLYIIGIPDPMYLLTLIYDSWLFFVYTVLILILGMRIIIPIVASTSIYKFNIYLIGMGVWTILDVFFRKRGL